MFQPKTDLIGRFTQHKVAANLLMIIMLISGVWALAKLNIQFFPDFDLDYINVNVVWSGASAEDMESGVADVLENRFRTLDSVKKVNSWSRQGISSIWMEYEDGTDMSRAQNEVNEALGQIRNLPDSAEKPTVRILERREIIARIVISGPEHLSELRPLVNRFEKDLLDLGAAEVGIVGLPEEELAIKIPQATLHDLNLTLDQIADKIALESRDSPVGEIGRAAVARELRSVEQRRDELGYANLPLLTGPRGRVITVGEIAELERRPKDGSITMQRRGKPAVELVPYRASNADTLVMAKRLQRWVNKTRADLPPSVTLTVYDEQWKPISDRINMLMKNGISGLVVIIIVLFLFLNGRVAFWVTVGIPTSFMATLLVLYFLGGSINMISLFAMIMALGIIVDDAIVVGEDALTHYQQGENALQSAEGGARRMFWPVMSSSLTTVAAFLPLMLVGSYIGSMLFAIPLVVICVIIASLVESFLVLPGHLRGTLSKQGPTGKYRQKLDGYFDHFREQYFRPLVQLAIRRRGTTVIAAVGLLVFALGMLASRAVGFVFFPTPELHVLIANASFVAGTPQSQIQRFMAQVETAIDEVDQELGPDLVKVAVTRFGSKINPANNFPRSGKNYAHMQIELPSSDAREVRNPEFIAAVQAKLPRPAALESFALFEPSVGPPGRDLEIRLSGGTLPQLKTAANELKASLAKITGILAIEDDTAYGAEQFLVQLKPQGHMLGLTTTDLSRQLRAAFDGRMTQIFQDQGDEIEVRVVLPDAERDDPAQLANALVKLPSGNTTPLSNVADFTAQRGFNLIRHSEGRRAITITADVDDSQANANQITAKFTSVVLPALQDKYGINAEFTGQQEDQDETMSDIQLGLLYGLILIYLVLAWVFSSYGWPVIVMAIIPFGLTGALIGHWVLGIDMTMLSMFGFFGLSGIVVNDSIILVMFYKELREKGLAVHDALVEASCQRLRAVLLTSLTTIGGLIPLMFETSLQAQFLIPMATSITFGLAFATLIVLVLVPTLLSFYEDRVAKVIARRLAATR